MAVVAVNRILTPACTFEPPAVWWPRLGCQAGAECPCTGHLQPDARLLTEWGINAAAAPHLTRLETQMVAALLPPGVLLPWQELTRAIAAGGMPLQADWHTMRVHLYRLRPKLRARGWRVLNAFGLGYQLVREAASEKEETP